MKFARLFFILSIVITAKVSFAANNNAFRTHLLASDTTIRLDTLHKVQPSAGKKNQPARPSRSAKPTSAVKDTSSKAKGGLQSMVKWNAEDSTYADNEHNIMYLYGKARVTYEDFELDADYIKVDQKNHTIFAKGRIDPKTHRYVGRPITKQKADKPSAADSLYYNYETKKGKVFNPASEQEGNFISGGLAKKLNETEVAYHNVLYSTCDLPYPDTHFGIVITKGIATKSQIISGPVYLEIANVPIPLALPFGFFPKPDHRASGVILPTFGEDPQRGFFLQNFGYYLGLNDNIDLTNTASVYSKGSYELGTAARYLKRYKYQGNLALRFTSNKYGNPGDPVAKDFNILWSHTQDPNAHPGSVFSASVNAGTHGYYSNSPAQQNYSIQQATQNSLSSSISYQRTWAGSPFNFNISLHHSQDLAARTVSLELPTFGFNMTSISPFDSKDRVGDPKWYQRITVAYTSSGTNKVTAIPEDQLFKGDILSKRLSSGFTQNIPVNLSLTFLKYFQFGTNVTYNEYWNFQTTRERYDRNNTVIGSQSNLIIDTIPGFRRAGDYNLGASLSTKLYGTMLFKGKGRLKALRHVLTPQINFGYHPDFGAPSYGYYQTVVSQATVPYPYTAQTYSIFGRSAYPGPAQGKSAGMGLSFDNSVEAKFRAKSTDTLQTDKIVPLLQGFSISTFYNFAADSFKLTPFSFSGHTAVFNQRLNISFGGVLNPYEVNIRDSIGDNQVRPYGRMIDRYTWQDGHLPRLSNFYASTSISLNSNSKAQSRGGVQQANVNANTLQGLTPEQAERLAMVNQDQTAFVDFNVPWNVNLSYSFNYSNDGLRTSVTNTVQATGDVSITPKWKVTYYSDIDIRHQKVSTCQLGIYRDLHCWDLSIQWIPFGYLKMYSVMLRVKASILQDLKLSKKSDYTNNSFYNPYY